MKIQYAAQTDPGRVRKNNEDNYLALPDQGLFVVADGMGGHNAGEVASQIAVDTLAEVAGKLDVRAAHQNYKITIVPD